MRIFSENESSVQCYARSFPVVFDKARGIRLIDRDGNEYLDFLAGAGSLNYGHNNPVLKTALLDYINDDGIAHGLDLHTQAKADFLQAFREIIQEPRRLDYRVQFTGPTGTNAVEAALKIARKVTGRTNVIAFTNGFHGVTLGAVSATGNSGHRAGAGMPLSGVTRMPYCGYHGTDVDTLKMMDRLLGDPSSGIDDPAAVIVETVQGEGGLNTATPAWLVGLERLCRKYGMLLIIDDIQAGCGRTGSFFSFEASGIEPDIVTLSKSLSGFGLPLAVTLMKPEYDQWSPGEHNGTFRGNNHSFVTAATALKYYWKDTCFIENVRRKAAIVGGRLKSIADSIGVPRIRQKGRGMMQGLQCMDGDTAEKISNSAFEKGLIIETSGRYGEVVKCLCPLTIDEAELHEGLDILSASVHEVLETGLSRAS